MFASNLPLLTNPLCRISSSATSGTLSSPEIDQENLAPRQVPPSTPVEGIHTTAPTQGLPPTLNRLSRFHIPLTIAAPQSPPPSSPLRSYLLDRPISPLRLPIPANFPGLPSRSPSRAVRLQMYLTWLMLIHCALLIEIGLAEFVDEWPPFPSSSGEETFSLLEEVINGTGTRFH
jgi:hypothetical protein